MPGRGALAFVLAACVACLMLGGAGSAAAATDKREVQARADFAAGRYQQAIDTFALLYGETLNPIYLRNIGRCHQKLKRPQEAIDAFREYLNKAKTMTPAERQEIDGYIRDMEALQAASAPAPAPPLPVPSPTPVAPSTPTPAPAAAPASVPAPAEAPPVATTTKAPERVIAPLPAAPAPAGSPAIPAVTLGAASEIAPPPSHGGAWRTAGLVTALAGVALVGVGVAFGLAARSVSDSVGVQYDPVKSDNGRFDERIGVAADILGTTAIATGIFLHAHGAAR